MTHLQVGLLNLQHYSNRFGQFLAQSKQSKDALLSHLTLLLLLHYLEKHDNTKITFFRSNKVSPIILYSALLRAAHIQGAVILLLCYASTS